MGFRYPVTQHIICTLYGVVTTPSQVSFHHHLSPIFSSTSLHPPLLSDNHPTVVHDHKFLSLSFLAQSLYLPPPVLQSNPPLFAVNLLSICESVSEKAVVPLHNGILLSCKKVGNLTFCTSMDAWAALC